MWGGPLLLPPLPLNPRGLPAHTIVALVLWLVTGQGDTYTTMVGGGFWVAGGALVALGGRTSKLFGLHSVRTEPIRPRVFSVL